MKIRIIVIAAMVIFFRMEAAVYSEETLRFGRFGTVTIRGGDYRGIVEAIRKELP